jgi:hypothetical protein
MGNNTRFDSPVIVHSLYAAGTTQFGTQRGAQATNFSLSGVLRSAQGLQFAGNVAKQFAAGTYIGVGGATAPIISTGLSSLTHVLIHKIVSGNSAATTGMVFPRPALAAGTPGSFYPILYKTLANGGITINTVAGTFKWVGLGSATL